jgi:hypothetical protein
MANTCIYAFFWQFKLQTRHFNVLYGVPRKLTHSSQQQLVNIPKNAGSIENYMALCLDTKFNPTKEMFHEIPIKLTHSSQ